MTTDGTPIVFCRLSHTGQYVGDPTAPDTYNPHRNGVCDGCQQLITGDTGVFATDGSGRMWHDPDCIGLSRVRDEL